MLSTCDGNSSVNGNINPVTLVRIVVNRKTPVKAGIRCDPSMPNITTRPEATATRLMITWRRVKFSRLNPSIMARVPLDDHATMHECHGENATAARHGTRVHENARLLPRCFARAPRARHTPYPSVTCETSYKELIIAAEPRRICKAHDRFGKSTTQTSPWPSF